MYKQKIVDALTGEETWKDLTKEEIVVFSQWEDELKALHDERKVNESHRQTALAKLAALGLTEDEIAAL